MQTPLTDAELDALRQIDTPTIANAIEPFNVRSDTDGFMGWDIRCLFPEMGVMAGYAVTATLDTTTHGRVHDREARFQLFEAIDASPKPVVLALKDLSSKPKHGCHFGDGLATVSMRLGAIGLEPTAACAMWTRCARWASTISRRGWCRRTATSALWRRRFRCE